MLWMRPRVLIVDDHAGFRRRAGAVLAAGGYDVVGEAADAASGLRAARELAPDVVLLDIGLPDASGFDVLTALAGGAAPPAVVLISSRTADDYGTRVATSPARGFLTKAELSPEALAALLTGGAGVNGVGLNAAGLNAAGLNAAGLNGPAVNGAGP
jgi:DNA-binding NarL/FixJ family response regulator